MIRLTVLAFGSALFAGLLSSVSTGDKPAKDPKAANEMSEPDQDIKTDQALLGKHPAKDSRVAHRQNKYVAYWLMRDPPDPENTEYEPVLLLARYSLEQFIDLQKQFPGHYERWEAEELKEKRSPVEAIEAMALTIETYNKDSIWDPDGRPYKPIRSIRDINLKARRAAVNDNGYQYEDCPIKDVIHLLEHPKGTIPIHRVANKRAGPPQTQTTRALILLLKEQLASEAAKKESRGAFEVFLESSTPRDLNRALLTFPWISTVEYDPKNPSDESFTLLLRNRSDKAITLPRNFDGKAFQLFSSGISGGKFWLIPTAEVDPADSQQIPPGETRVIFELPMKEILADHEIGAANPLPRKWLWTRGNTRGISAVSPLHKRGGYADFAVFWAEVQFDGQTLRTEPMIVKTK